MQQHGQRSGDAAAAPDLPDDVLLIAHRGASGSAPENTLAALRRARALGATGAEVDVQRTADGVLVLVHDDTWKRTAGLDRAVCDTPWETVRGLDAGAWFGPQWVGEPVPRLDDVLALAGDGWWLDLEIKSPERHPGIAPQIADAVRRAGLQAQVLLTSFDAALVEHLAEAASDLELGYLSYDLEPGAHPRVRSLAVHHAALEQAPARARRAAATWRVLAWTVDDPNQARGLVELGVRGIVTNYPERFRRRRT